MASSTEIMHAEDTTSLVGGRPALDARGDQPTVVVPPPRHNTPTKVSQAASSPASMDDRLRAARAAFVEAFEKTMRPKPGSAPLPRNPVWWRRLVYLVFPPDPIYVGQPLTAEQLDMLDEEERRSTMPGYFERLAMDRRLVTECLRQYNLKNPGNEYEPAPGMLTQHFHFDKGICWTHGNFVARKKRCDHFCFSFLPGPRTLFFFELAYKDGFDGVVTCIPLDEPVTEAYSVLGFPLWWSTRRNGEMDSFCKACKRRFDLPHPGIQKECPCGSSKVGIACKMCYLRSPVLHPCPGKFAFGC